MAAAILRTLPQDAGVGVELGSERHESPDRQGSKPSLKNVRSVPAYTETVSPDLHVLHLSNLQMEKRSELPFLLSSVPKCRKILNLGSGSCILQPHNAEAESGEQMNCRLPGLGASQLVRKPSQAIFPSRRAGSVADRRPSKAQRFWWAEADIIILCRRSFLLLFLPYRISAHLHLCILCDLVQRSQRLPQLTIATNANTHCIAQSRLSSLSTLCLSFTFTPTFPVLRSPRQSPLKPSSYPSATRLEHPLTTLSPPSLPCRQLFRQLPTP